MASQRKNGPLCSCHLHKGPAWLLVARILRRRKRPPACAARAQRPLRCYPSSMRFLPNDYFFFAVFFVFFAFFAFFAFLAMLPSVVPKSSLNASRATCINSEYTPIAKLISRDAKMVNAVAICHRTKRSRSGRSSHVI
jgi:hypothetical protein